MKKLIIAAVVLSVLSGCSSNHGSVSAAELSALNSQPLPPPEPKYISEPIDLSNGLKADSSKPSHWSIDTENNILKLYDHVANNYAVHDTHNYQDILYLIDSLGSRFDCEMPTDYDEAIKCDGGNSLNVGNLFKQIKKVNRVIYEGYYWVKWEKVDRFTKRYIDDPNLTYDMTVSTFYYKGHACNAIIDGQQWKFQYQMNYDRMSEVQYRHQSIKNGALMRCTNYKGSVRAVLDGFHDTHA
ncbi:TPA: hypothetical protein ACX6SF_002437 [Photobacterium damselae]